MKCFVCGEELEIVGLIDWSDLSDDEGDIYGQETNCPECGTPIWIPSWTIEELLEAKP